MAVAGLTGATLAAAAVLLFLGSLRQTFIIVLAIPLAILTALVLMGLFGLSLNVFSLGGLALGVGIVVDNSIVMLENIARRAEEHQAEMHNGRRSIGGIDSAGGRQQPGAGIGSAGLNHHQPGGGGAVFC